VRAFGRHIPVEILEILVEEDRVLAEQAKADLLETQIITRSDGD
jgi:hypothetical protein